MLVLVFLLTLLSNSCDTGCGCPGGAGYGHNNQQPTTQRI